MHVKLVHYLGDMAKSPFFLLLFIFSLNPSISKTVRGTGLKLSRVTCQNAVHVQTSSYMIEGRHFCKIAISGRYDHQTLPKY